MGPDRDLAILISLARTVQSESLRGAFELSEIQEQLTKGDSRRVAAALLRPDGETPKLRGEDANLLSVVKQLAGVKEAP